MSTREAARERAVESCCSVDCGGFAPQALSKQITTSILQLSNNRRRKRHSWRTEYSIDQQMRSRFQTAGERIASKNIRLHRGSYRINALLTINSGQISATLHEPYTSTETRIIQNLRNSFRGRKHSFSGLWRREVFGHSPMGVHLHLALHLPRGVRQLFLESLPVWLGDQLDQRFTSKRFNRPNWKAVSIKRTWHLCRVYHCNGLLDYLAKIPLDTNGRPLDRAARCKFLGHSAREFGVFGLRSLYPVSRSSQQFLISH